MTDLTRSNLLLASRWRRLAATFIDATLVPAVTIFLVMILDVAEQAEDFVDQWWAVHVVAIAVCSYLALNGYTLYQNSSASRPSFINQQQTAPMSFCAFPFGN